MQRLTRLATALAVVSLVGCRAGSTRGPESEPSPGPDPDVGERDDATAERESASSPAPQTVCAHVADVFEAEQGSPGAEVRADMVDTCVGALQADHAHYGDEFYANMSRCLLDAGSVQAMGACDPDSMTDEGRAQQAALEATIAELPEDLRPDRICDHMATLLAADDPDFAAYLAQPGERPRFVQVCAGDVVQQIRLRGVEGYLSEARCVVEAGDQATMEACASTRAPP